MARTKEKNIREMAAELEASQAGSISKSSAKRATKSVRAPASADDRLRARVKRYLIQRFYTRFHMSLILASSGFAAMLTNWAMLREGVHAMWMRYPVAMALAYLTFLAGVWLWLKYTDATRACMADNNPNAKTKSLVDGGDVLNTDLVPNFGGGGGGGGAIEVPGPLGGGGSFDGGGAGGGWVEANPVQSLTSDATPTPSGGGFFDGVGDKLGGFCDLDGDAVVLIVIALMLMGSLILLGGYVIWFAPDILSEAVFGATLAGGLAHAAKRHDEGGWVMGVVKKTWWPFAIVFVFAMIFAFYAAVHYPQASTFGGALSAAIAG